MDIQEIIERFALMANLSLEKASQFTYICNDAKSEIESKLKEETNTEDNSGRLNVAAATLSFYKYTCYKVSNLPAESISAGDINIKENSERTMKIAYRMWAEAKATIADLLRDDDFTFRRVIVDG